MPDQQDKFGKYALVLLVTGVLGRLLLMALHWLSPFAHVQGFDGSYIQAAQDIVRFNFRALGDRVPVYPLLIALCGVNFRVIWVVQAFLGVAGSWMIFDMAFRGTRHALFSLLVGLACGFIPELLFFESAVITETLTSFLLVTSVWLIARNDAAEKNRVHYSLGLGSIAALAGLTRPLMICLVPVYFCFLVSVWPPAKILKRVAFKRVAFFSFPVFVLLLGWCGFNYFNSGYFTPTTRAGQQMMDQVDPYVDLAPDRYAALRDAWLHTRQQLQINPNRTHEDVYYSELDELERRTGKTDAQVSQEFVSLALYLEIHHPLLCLRRAEQGWMQFWGEPSHNEVEWPPGGKIGLSESVMALAKFLVRELKAIFLVLALLSVPCALFRREVFTRLEYLIFTMALWVSTFAAFTEYGDNHRFCVPFYMLITYAVLTRIWRWITATPFLGAGAS